jgi:GntR family transcriptional repressor for pyruvate dehydrogenase complex
MTDADLSTSPAPRDRVSMIAHELRSRILSGELPPGTRLPAEIDLCERFGVSRPTLREALGRLTAQGLILSRRGAQGGAYVARPDRAALVQQIAGLLALADGDAQHGWFAAARTCLSGAISAETLARMRAEIDRQSDFSLSDQEFAHSFLAWAQALAQAGAGQVGIMAEAALTLVAPIVTARSYGTRHRARILSFHVLATNALSQDRMDHAAQALADLDAYLRSLDTDRTDTAQQAKPQFPPRMRDLRRPPVQRVLRQAG